MNKKSAIIAIFATLLLLASVIANANSVLLDNLNTNAPKSDAVSGILTDDGDQRAAANWTSASVYYLDKISVYAQYVSGSTSFELALYSNTKNTKPRYIPFTEIASRIVTADPSATDFRLYTADFSSLQLRLDSDTIYWAVVQATIPNSNLNLQVLEGTPLTTFGNIQPKNRFAMYGDMGLPVDPYWMSMYQPGFKVTGTTEPVRVVPEPSSLLALMTWGIGLVGIAKKKAYQVMKMKSGLLR